MSKTAAKAAAAAPPAPGPRPFLRWVGGKTQLLPHLLAHMPPKFARYHEPFVGAGALFFALAGAGRLARGSFLSDTNQLLIRTWQAVQQHPGQLILVLREMQKLYEAKGAAGGEAFYLRMRAEGPSTVAVRAAAWMIFMNKTCFNGVYRVNKSGKFNVPHGKFKTPPVICAEDVLQRATAALDLKTFIFHGDFRETLQRAQRGDAVYFDPPYAPLSKTSDFTSFTSAGFSDADQRDLRDAARALKKRGVHVLLSNSSAPIIRELYGEGDFKIIEVPARRSVNAKTDSRGAVPELLIK